MTSAFETVVAEFCDRCGELVDAGTTRPYTGSKLYRACAECIAQMEQQRDAGFCRDCGYRWDWHPPDEIADGMALRHPTEAEARERSGAQ